VFLQAKQWNERTSITNILQTIETEVEEESKKKKGEREPEAK
jgi:hypothetical protein